MTGCLWLEGLDIQRRAADEITSGIGYPIASMPSNVLATHTQFVTCRSFAMGASFVSSLVLNDFAQLCEN